MEEVLMAAVVFTAIYQIIKVFTDYLLKRRLIISGHVDKPGILEGPKDKEEISYPTLKWGLVSLFAGLGLLVIYLITRSESMDFINGNDSYLSIGIELIAISVGFLTYFIIARFSIK